MTDAPLLTHPFPGVRLLLMDIDGTVRRCTVPGQPCPSKRGESELYPGTVEILNTYREAGVAVAFVTNQDSVGLGLMTHEAFNDTIDELREMLEWDDLDVLACTHAPGDECECGKPSPRMLLDAMKESGAGPENTVYVGNMKSDLQAAMSAGLHRFWFSWMFNPSVPVAQWFEDTPMVQ